MPLLVKSHVNGYDKKDGTHVSGFERYRQKLTAPQYGIGKKSPSGLSPNLSYFFMPPKAPIMNMRESQATAPTRRIRASRNTLFGFDLFTRTKKCADFKKAFFSGFAQSSFLNVVGQCVEGEQQRPRLGAGED